MTLLETLSAMADAVEKAIALIPCSKDRGLTVEMGADGTCTSQIDKIAENTILDYIQRHSVELNVLSEEIGFVDNGYEDTLVLDPIDGTSNAIANVPLYTISMAVGKKSLLDLHTAYLRNPVTGDEYIAEKGKGATKNGKPLQVRKKSDLDDLFMMIYLGNGAHADAFALAKRVRSSRAYGCASLEMALVAEGEADGFMMYAERFTRSIRVVDIAASILLLREAGGDAYDMDGKVLDMPFDIAARSNFVAFGDPRVFDFIMKTRGETAAHHKFGVAVNTTIPNVKKHVQRVMDALEGQNYIMEQASAELMGVEGCPLDKMDVDTMIAIGGDGTMLRTLLGNKSPLVGVNAGGVGFLAEIEIDEIEEGIKRIVKGEYTVEERFKISSWYNGEYTVDAVNEVVVHTDSVAKIRHFKVYVNDKLATEVRADGIIVSTPTGSTCYAMSLGAPIIDPSVNAFVIVPMAAYKFASRPFVVPADAKVTIEMIMDSGCLLVVDGQTEYKLDGKTHIDFFKSAENVRFVKFSKDFYSRVRDKLVNAI